jgi:tRNA pseudouridine55 synthase
MTKNDNISREGFLNGEIVLINKPLEWTSFNVVKKMRNLLQRKYALKKIKVGHAGTLDPLASGLLIICIGKSTKKISDLQTLTKEYIATIKFGATTPSFDLETQIDAVFPYKHITQETLRQIIDRQFSGTIEQTPPAFSAKRVNGKRAYVLARKGEDVKLKPAIINILEIEINEFNLPVVKLRISCGKGTYIRSLAYDLGIALNSGGHLIALERTQIGTYLLENALTIKEFETVLESAE